MSRERDPLAPRPNWRVDLRLVAELPEDNVIGTRFIVHVAFSAVALAALIFAGLFGYRDYKLRHEIRDWERRIKENAAEVREIGDMGKKYAAEAAKIDQAWTLIRPQLHVSRLLKNLGRTRPEALVIDVIDWNEAGIVVRCNIHESPLAAAKILGSYLDLLKRDEDIGPLFFIRASDLSRGNSNDAIFRSEIIFRLKPAKP